MVYRDQQMMMSSINTTPVSFKQMKQPLPGIHDILSQLQKNPLPWECQLDILKNFPTKMIKNEETETETETETKINTTSSCQLTIGSDNSEPDTSHDLSMVDEDEEREAEELINDYEKENNISSSFSSSSTYNCSLSNSIEAKKKRIMRRCAEVFDNINMSEELRNQATCLMDKHINGISDIKLKKKSHRALAVGITVLALKELGIQVDVKETSKMIPRTDRHHKTNVVTKSSEKSEAICISRLACSISNENKRRDELDHSKGTLLATEELIKKLNIGPKEANLARHYSSFSENTALASRHAQSIAAAAVCLATNMQVSVSEVVKASQISATTVRKTIVALKSLNL